MTRPTLHRCELPRLPRRRLQRPLLLALLIGCLLPGSLSSQDRVDPVPSAPRPIVEALSPFAGDPDSSRVASLLAEVAEHDFPARDYDRVLVARLWRRAGESELAMANLEAIPSGSDAVDLAVYEAARTLFEARRDVPGARAYWSACESADHRVRHEIAWDLLPVTTPEEREAWTELPAGPPTCDWLRAFWDERAQGMARARDERLAIHFRRLAHARAEMWIKGPRFYREMTDEHGRPAGLSIDDRGLVFVRLGEPDARQACSVDEDALAECWAYYRTTGYRLFQFSQYKKARGDVVPDGDYTLDEGVPYLAPGDAWNHKYVLNADIPLTAKRALNLRWRAAYRAEGIYDETERGFDDAEFEVQGERALVLASRRYADAVLLEVPDVPDIESTLRLRFETLRFLNPSSRRWQAWLLTSVRAGDLTPSSEDDYTATRDVGGRFSILPDGKGVEITEIPARTVSAASSPDESGIGLRGAFTAEPGALPMTVVVEDLNAPGTGAWIQDTVNVPAIGGLPQLSDIAVAQAEGGTWTRDGQTFLQVSPAHITNPDGSIHTYFEAYGLRAGATYDVEFRLAPLGAAERIWRLEPGDLAFRLRFTSEMAGDIGRHHLRLDLSDTEPGEYVLAVRIQDEETKAYSLPSVTDVFVAERS